MKKFNLFGEIKHMIRNKLNKRDLKKKQHCSSCAYGNKGITNNPCEHCRHIHKGMSSNWEQITINNLSIKKYAPHKGDDMGACKHHFCSTCKYASKGITDEPCRWCFNNSYKCFWEDRSND